MAVETFDHLKEGIAAQLGVSLGDLDRASRAATTSMDVDGITVVIDHTSMVLTYASDVRTDRAFIICDFGALPADREAAALRRLMEMNFMFYRGNAPAFTCDPASGHVLFCCEILFHAVTPSQVLDVMKSMAAQSQAWRQHYFLEQDMAPTDGTRDYRQFTKAIDPVARA